MKEVFVEGQNGDKSFGKTVLVEDARELVDTIRSIATKELGVRAYTINNTSGTVIAPIGLKDMDEEFESVCSVSIVPYNKAGQ